MPCFGVRVASSKSNGEGWHHAPSPSQTLHLMLYLSSPTDGLEGLNVVSLLL